MGWYRYISECQTVCVKLEYVLNGFVFQHLMNFFRPKIVCVEAESKEKKNKRKKTEKSAMLLNLGPRLILKDIPEECAGSTCRK